MSACRLALFIVRIPLAPYQATVCFNAVDISADGDDEFIPDGRAIENCFVRNELRKDAFPQLEISQIHATRHGFLYQLKDVIDVSVGDLLTNNVRLAHARVMDVRFQLRNEEGLAIKLSDDFLPEVIRGNGFIGVCYLADNCDEGRFFLFDDRDVSGPVTIDGCEFSSPISISVRHG